MELLLLLLLSVNSKTNEAARWVGRIISCFCLESFARILDQLELSHLIRSIWSMKK